MNESDKLQEMLFVNKEQKEFYEGRDDIGLNRKGNVFTRLWRIARRSQIAFREAIHIDTFIYNMHSKWLSNLSDKSVLDLGCYNGNFLSILLAQNSQNYIGIDLSENAIEDLNKKLIERKINNAIGISKDFLSDEFQMDNKEKFDVIYAHSVAHHFKHFEVFLEKCHNCLREDGVLITFDPLQTYLPMYLMRQLYRPFQSDKDWEYPFKRENIKLIRKFFDIVNIQGIMGKAKLASPIYFFNHKVGIRLGLKWAEHDKIMASKEGKSLYNCLQVTLRLKKTT